MNHVAMIQFSDESFSVGVGETPEQAAENAAAAYIRSGGSLEDANRLGIDVMPLENGGSTFDCGDTATSVVVQASPRHPR